MRVIGAGWGRTGTTSAAAALDRLGAGPVLHMMQMFTRPHEAAQWSAYRRGEQVDLAALVSPYGAGVDWPVCWAWQDLAALFPEAPVLLTTRDPEQWYDSVRSSIHLWADPNRPAGPPPAAAAEAAPGEAASADAPTGPPPEIADLLNLMWDSEFGGWEAVLDRDATIAAYVAHVDSVKASCPPERLVQWSVTDGWEPLAALLGLPVPDEPFPHLNSRGDRPPAPEDHLPTPEDHPPNP